MAIDPKCIPSAYYTFLTQAILTLLMCNIIYYSLKPWIKSRVFCNMLAGIILGRMVLGQNKIYMDTVFPDEEMLLLDTLVRLVAGLLYFLSAVKFDTSMFFEIATTVWIVNVPGFIANSLYHFYGLKMLQKKIPEFFGQDAHISVIGSSISSTSFTTIADAIEEHNLLTTELGQLSMSSGMINESFNWIVVVFSQTMRRKSSLGSIMVLVFLSVLLLFVYFIVRPAMNRIIRTTPEGRSVDQSHIVMVLICAMVLGIYTRYILMVFPLGPFLVGLVVPHGPPLSTAIVEKYEFMIKEFFEPLAFLFIGYQIDLSFAWHDTKDFIILMVFAFGGHLAKSLGILLGSIFTKIMFRNSVLISFISNYKGIIELLLLKRWYMREEFDKRMYSTLVLSNILATLLYDYLIQILYKPHTRLVQSEGKGKYFKVPKSIPSDEKLHVLTCVHNEENVYGIITLLRATNPTGVHVIHAMEFSGQLTPHITPYQTQKKRGESCHIMKAFFNYSKSTNGVVSIYPFTVAAPYKTMHNLICNYAEDIRTPFIIVPFRENQLDINNNNQIRVFNVELQENAPSVVGILVDNGFSRQEKLTSILVIFLGGHDDREALRLACRMSSNPNLGITILRVKVKMNIPDDDDYIDERIDESILQKFKNCSNANVVFNDVEVKNCWQLISIIESLEKDYDLIMVGKMPNNKQLIKEMILSIEYQELGLIGDLIVSSNFHCSKTSVLVLQQFRQIDQTDSVTFNLGYV